MAATVTKRCTHSVSLLSADRALMYMLKPVLALPVVYSLTGRFICFLDIACSSTIVPRVRSSSTLGGKHRLNFTPWDPKWVWLAAGHAGCDLNVHCCCVHHKEWIWPAQAVATAAMTAVSQQYSIKSGICVSDRKEDGADNKADHLCQNLAKHVFAPCLHQVVYTDAQRSVDPKP